MYPWPRWLCWLLTRHRLVLEWTDSHCGLHGRCCRCGEAREIEQQAEPDLSEEHCHAGLDGVCTWEDCPQVRDGEPQKAGRICPLPRWDEER